MIREYFGNGNNFGVSIQYIEEEERLGTAGSLRLLPETQSSDPIVVMNADILTKVNLGHLLDFHASYHSKATMGIREYNFQVPYGVLKLDQHRIIQIEEKPVHDFFVNAGIYVLNKTLINKLDGKSYLDMTDLLDKELINEKVNAFPIHEYWLDIGKIEEYERANREVFTEFN